MRDEVEALLQALSENGCAGAEGRMANLLGALQHPLDPALTRTVLDRLRSQRCFVAMDRFAARAAKLAQGTLAVYVKRQQEQAKFDLGYVEDAVAVLEPPAEDVRRSGSGRERSEVVGLLGRARKQLFVQAAAAGLKGHDELRAAVRAHGDVYDLDPSWHGANLVALVARAERDGFSAETDIAQVWANRLLDDLRTRAKPSWSPWDHAAAGEAYLALDDRQGIAESFAQYWNSRCVDAFALAGTERNLREIWQITDASATRCERPCCADRSAQALVRFGRRCALAGRPRQPRLTTALGARPGRGDIRSRKRRSARQSAPVGPESQVHLSTVGPIRAPAVWNGLSSEGVGPAATRARRAGAHESPRPAR